MRLTSLLDLLWMLYHKGVQRVLNPIRNYISVIQGLVLVFIIFLTSFYNYVLFHSLAESVGFVILLSVFIIVWNSRVFVEDNFILIVGMSCFAIGVIEILHTLSYRGVGIFVGYDANLPTQLWTAMQAVTSLSFFAGAFFLGRKKLSPNRIFIFFASLLAIVLISIFYLHIYPTAYVDGIGQTQFKKISEYIFSIIYLVAIVQLYVKRRFFGPRFFIIINLVLVAMAARSVIFTSYVGVYDHSNLIGHLFLVLSHYLIYVAMVEEILRRPYRTIFKNLKDSEVALKNSEERYRSLVESSPVAIVVHADNKILFINRLGLDLFGAKNESQVLGKDILEFTHPESRDFTRLNISQFGRGLKQTPLDDLSLIKLDGSRVDVESTSRAIVFQGIDAIQSIFNDVTERRKMEDRLMGYAIQMEEEKAKDDALLSSLGDGIVFANSRGRVLYINQAFEELADIKLDEIKNKNFVEVVPLVNSSGEVVAKEDRPTVQALALRKKIVVGGLGTPPFYLQKGGVRVAVSVTVTPVVFKEKLIGVIGIFRDNTKEREIDRAKTEFISLASHQLRTPLSGIGLSSELLLRGVAGSVTEEQKEYLEEINESTQRMSNLVSVLLNISRIEMGTITITPEVLNPVKETEAVLKDFKKLIAHKKIKIEKRFDDNAPLITFDKNVFAIMTENIISNAIRYTSTGGEITISIKKEKAGVLITIEDTGCGIPKESHKDIFTKLFRAQNAKSASFEGLGLGLYMTKHLAEKTGSKIWFKSKEGVGTKFYLSIPTV